MVEVEVNLMLVDRKTRRQSNTFIYNGTKDGEGDDNPIESKLLNATMDDMKTQLEQGKKNPSNSIIFT